MIQSAFILPSWTNLSMKQSDIKHEMDEVVVHLCYECKCMSLLREDIFLGGERLHRGQFPVRVSLRPEGLKQQHGHSDPDS